MIVLEMAILNLVLTQQIYSEEKNDAHAHNRDCVPLRMLFSFAIYTHSAQFVNAPNNS